MNGQLVNHNNVWHGLCASSRSRAMPETENPPDKPVIFTFMRFYLSDKLLLKLTVGNQK